MIYKNDSHIHGEKKRERKKKLAFVEQEVVKSFHFIVWLKLNAKYMGSVTEIAYIIKYSTLFLFTSLLFTETETHLMSMN